MSLRNIIRGVKHDTKSLELPELAPLAVAKPSSDVEPIDSIKSESSSSVVEPANANLANIAKDKVQFI